MEIRCYQNKDFADYLRLRNQLDIYGQASSEEDVRTSLSLPKEDPHLNCFIVFDGGKAVGYSRIERNGDGTINRHYYSLRLEPQHQSNDALLDELIARVEVRLHEISAEYSDPLQIRCGCYQELKDYSRAYERNGYQFNRYYARLDLHDLETIRSPQLPDGIVIRPYDPSIESQKFIDAFNLGFEGHFEHHPMSVLDFDYFVKTPWYQPHHMFVAVLDDEFLGVSWNYYNKVPEADGLLWGIVSELAVIPQWRGKGLGRALIRHGMLALRKAGSERICLWVDYDNPFQAKKFYYNEGFIDRYVEINYEKNE